MKDIDQINSTLQDLDNRIIYLFDKLSKIENSGGTGDTTDLDLTQLTNDLENLKTKVQTLQTSLNNISAIVTQHDVFIQTLQTEVSEINTKIEEINVEIENINTSLTEIESKITQLQSDVKLNASAIGNMKITIITLANDVTELDDRVITNTNNIANLKNSVATNTNDISSLKTAVEENTANIENLQTAVENNTTDIENLQTAVENNTTDIENLQTAVNENTSNIESLQTAVSANTADIDSLKETVQENSTNIDAVTQKVNDNTTNIASNTTRIENLETRVTQNETDITDLKNNSGGGGDLTELTETVNEMQKVVDNFATLIKDRNAEFNNPYYGIDQNVVVQTVDGYNKNYEYTGDGSFNAGPYMVYVNPSSTTANIKIFATVSGTADATGVCSLYLNSNTLYESVEFNYTTEVETVEINFTVPVTENGLFFYFHIKASSTSTITFTHARVEVANCTNPIILNKLKKYQIDYFNGNYYITNTTGRTAKKCVIPVNEIATTNDIVWEDTGIKAQSMVATAFLNNTNRPYVTDLVSYAYILQDCTVYFENSYSNSTSSHTTYKMGYMTPQAPNAYPGTIWLNAISSNSIIKLKYYYTTKGLKSERIEETDTECAYFQLFRMNADEYPIAYNYKMYVKQMLNGDVILYYKDYAELNLGFGNVVNAYCINGSYFEYHIYVKVFNQMVRYHVTYDSVDKLFAIQSHEVIGEYDDYFEGYNNDYFVVKDDKLYYYKNSLQDVVE